MEDLWREYYRNKEKIKSQDWDQSRHASDL